MSRANLHRKRGHSEPNGKKTITFHGELAMANRRCCYCRTVFTPSIYHPSQQVCFSVDCQRTRRREDHRKRYQADLVYQQECRESAQKWREANPDYQRRYRQSHPDYVERNREAQCRRDHKRHLANLVKNNLAVEVKPPPKRVWLFGPAFEPLVKNNLVISEVVVFQHFATTHVSSG